jgi:tyrosinase
MVFTRKSVWAAGGDFSDPILFWYAKGVDALKQRPINDPTSWRFLAAIHGFDLDLWDQYDYFNDSDQLPSQSVQNTYWEQCQHQSWYFLPWHRGYLASLEMIVRDAIIQAGGPADWALPYWNYSENPTNTLNPRQLPPAFSRQTMPDNSPNPLFVTQRYGESVPAPSLPLAPETVTLEEALNEMFFKGQAIGGSPGFGGIETGFSHRGGPNGRLESRPHNGIHVAIGRGKSRSEPGLMSSPVIAALDPIFWLHHCNIDRLWEVWVNRKPQGQNPAGAFQNPTEALWLDGPTDRKFIVPLVDGQGWPFAPKDVLQTTATNLDYIYDDVSDPLQGVSAMVVRLNRLGASLSPDSAVGIPMENQLKAELIGANSDRVAMIGESISTPVRLDSQMMNKVSRSFETFAASESKTQEPDRIFLNLENIRSNEDSVLISVYMNVPSGANPTDHPDLYAGTIALFGVSQASQPDQPHGGMGVTEVLDITHIVDSLHLAGGLNVSNLEVTFLPQSPLTEVENVTVERVSIYRQGR